MALSVLMALVVAVEGEGGRGHSAVVANLAAHVASRRELDSDD